MNPDGVGPETVRYLGPPTDEHGRIRKYELPVGRAESLAVLTGEFVFFTPAVLYLYARFTDAPLFDFMWERGRETKLYYRRFQKPIFAGLNATSNGDPGWNHALWAVRQDEWQPLADFVCSLAWNLRDDRVMFNFGEQELTVVDPLALDRAGFYHRRLPVVSITAFGLHGNTGRLGFVAPADPFAAYPTLTRFPPNDEMVAFTDAFYRGTNPVAARDATRYQQRINAAVGRKPDKETDR